MTGHDLRGHPGRADDPGAAHPAGDRLLDARPSGRSRSRASGRADAVDARARRHGRSRLAAWPPRGSRRRRSPACLLSQWGIAVGTVVGWQASQSMMGLPTETFFMMMLKMMWFRDVVGPGRQGPALRRLAGGDLLLRGPADRAPSSDEPPATASARSHPAHGLAPPWSTSGLPGRLPVDAWPS